MHGAKMIGVTIVQARTADSADVASAIGCGPAPGLGLRIREGVGLGSGQEFLLIVVAEGLVRSGFGAMGRRIESAGFQTSGLCVILIANVLFPRPSADGKPFEASADGLDEIPWVEGIH